jgi:hypothetical protein
VAAHIKSQVIKEAERVFAFQNKDNRGKTVDARKLADDADSSR